MIRTFTLTIALIVFSNSYSQISSNSFLLGGNLGYTSITYSDLPDNQTSNYLNVTLFAGKAIKENTVVGVNVSWQPIYKSYNPWPAYSESRGIEVAPFFRKYKTIAKDLNLFADLEAGVAYYKVEYEEYASDYDTHYTSFRVSASPGISYKLLKNLHVQAKIPQIFRIRYTHNKNVFEAPGTPDDITNIFEIGTALSDAVSLESIVIGFYFELGAKRSKEK